MNSLNARYCVIGAFVLLMLASCMENKRLAGTRTLMGQAAELTADFDAPERPDRPTGSRAYKPRKPYTYSAKRPTKYSYEKSSAYNRRLKRWEDDQKNNQKKLAAYEKQLRDFKSKNADWIKYDAQLKEWNKEMKAYREQNKDKKKEAKELRKDFQRHLISALSGSSTVFYLRFLAAIIMLIGLGFMLIHGTEMERAAALLVAGLVIPKIMEIKGITEALGLGSLRRLF